MPRDELRKLLNSDYDVFMSLNIVNIETIFSSTCDLLDQLLFLFI